MDKNQERFRSEVGEDQIVGEYYVRAKDAFKGSSDDPALATLMLCVVTLKNGACLVGESRALSIDTFDETLGRQYAKGEVLVKMSQLRRYPEKEEIVYALFPD